MVRKLGQGGNGRVFLVIDKVLEKKRAIKIYYHSEKSKAELEILRLLDHPMIPSIIEYVVEKNFTAVVMEYLEGTNLQELCVQGKLLSVKEMLKLGIQLCQVLTYLHEGNPSIIYRDLKPQNIMLGKGGKVWLIDFDCACLADPAGRFSREGSRGFAAPEQFEGMASPASDIYALAVTLDLVSVPFTSPVLHWTLAKGKRKDPQRRYQRAGDLENALSKCLDLRSNLKGKVFLLFSVVMILLFFPILKTGTNQFHEWEVMHAEKNGNYEKALAVFPERESLYLDLLEKAAVGKKTKEILTAVEHTFQLYPKETGNMDSVRKKMAWIYLYGNSADDFSPDYEKAMTCLSEIKAPDAETRWGISLLQLLEDEKEPKDWGDLREKLAKAENGLAAFSTDRRYAMYLVLANVWVEKEYYLKSEECLPYEEAIRLIDGALQVIAAKKKNFAMENEEIFVELKLAQAEYLGGLAYEKKNLLEKSLKDYQNLKEQLVRGEKREKILRRIAYVEEILGDLEAAAEAYECLLEEYPDRVDDVIDYGLLESKREAGVEHARTLYKKAVEMGADEKNKNLQLLKERVAEDYD